MFVVFDLDGTLTCNKHRLHLIRQKKRDYEAYHALAVEDPPVDTVIDVLRRHWAYGDKVEVWTGRSATVWDDTRQWLALHGVNPGALRRMRPSGDARPNHVLKREWLDQQRAGGLPPELVYEDMPETVAMWRRAGVPCFQVRDV